MTGSWRYRLVVVLMLAGVGLLSYFMEFSLTIGIIAVVIFLGFELLWQSLRTLRVFVQRAKLKKMTGELMEWEVKGKLSLEKMFASLPGFWKDKVSKLDVVEKYCREHRPEILADGITSVLAVVKYDGAVIDEKAPNRSLRFIEFKIYSSDISDPISYRFGYKFKFSGVKYRLLMPSAIKDGA